MLTKLIKYGIFILIFFLISCGEEDLCEKGYIFSNDRCEPICSSEEIYNSTSNLCESKNDCNEGYSYNNERNRCEPICKDEETYSIVNNICKSNNDCNEGYNYNNERNRCEPICKDEETYSIVNNICENGNNCNEDYNYNEERNRCEPICKDKEIYNILNNICEIDNSCENNYLYNNERERCEPICKDYEEYYIQDNICNEIEILTEELFNLIFRNSAVSSLKSSLCPGYDFYTYDSLRQAMNDYPHFANEGSLEKRKREVAAFFANISHETTGGGQDENRYYWGLCWIEQISCQDSTTEACRHCNTASSYECVDGKYYYGRGPIQLTWNYNYGAMGDVLSLDLLSNPDLISTDASISFKTALWFWMTPQSPKPSAHDVMIGNWSPSESDIEKNRDVGFGMTINIINGGNECDKVSSSATDRINHYKKFCEILDVPIGDNLDCEDMEHY